MGALALAVGGVTAGASTAQANGASVIASFEGEKIDLSKASLPGGTPFSRFSRMLELYKVEGHEVEVYERGLPSLMPT
ncbi:hypothetical protein [Streptomyces sp. H34-S4]|uniref:hypothetical protein n=1 Tax=Streptomyces sp. H34-S4 TaxID=2996463 RepID=UPI00226DDB6F|nr:hypothetical protein [Streptomyces sp. H34-S4]MCY0936435.1 hypothetical protein [Streptomyces sp. H34-S4]